jgi:hypothetical protein
MADTLSALKIPKATAFLSGANAPVTPKGYVGMRELAPIQEELATAESQAQKDVGMADINIERAKREETTRDLESQSKFAKEEADKLRDLPERQAMKEKRKEFGDFKFVPTKENAQDLATLFSLVSVIGMAIGGGGKENAQASMSAMNGMLEGHQKGRADLYKQQQIEFDKNFKAMQAAVQSAEKEYEEAVKMHLVDKEAGEMARKMALAKMHSPMLKAMEDRLGPLAVLNTLKELKTSVKNATELENKLQAQADKRQDAKDAKEAAERRHREDAAARLQQHKEDAAQRERLAKAALAARISAKTTAADRYGFGDIVAGASNEAAAAIRNLMGLPFESTSGIFGGKQTNSLFTAPLDAFANTLTSESVQRYNTQSGKLGYNLAQLMSGGRAVRVSDVDQMNKILQIREGDTLETAASRIAEARQLAERTIEIRAKSPNTPEGLKEVFKENLQTIQETVPFTVDDINKFVANRDKSITFAQALNKRYPSSESAPSLTSAVAPGGVGKRGGATREASSVDVERNKAKAAIAGGKDPDAVKARFKEKTGQEL